MQAGDPPSAAGQLIDARLDEAALRALLRELPAQVVERVVARARPAVRFATQRVDPAAAPVGVSRFGGAPDLPPDRPWPTRQPRDGGSSRALTFVAQVRLDGPAELVDLPLPETGLLSVFCDLGLDDGAWGLYMIEPGGAQITHLDVDVCTRRDPPAQLAPLPAALLQPIAVMTIGQEDIQPYYHCEEALEEHIIGAVPAGWDLAGRHQLGGHAYYIQHPVEEQALQSARGVWTPEGGLDKERWTAVHHELVEWRLLLQIDNDHTLDDSWGDVTLFWVASRDQIAARAWSQVWFDYQLS